MGLGLMLLFPAYSNNTIECAEITIVPDTILEGAETFSVFIDSTEGAPIVNPMETTVTIIDDECKYNISYYQCVYNQTIHGVNEKWL